ncbi:hypothetical protein [Nocardia sp. NPDC058497]|uniref:hypothetical protein n=1 Tax=Nocardia sp. NPDC058497 TaxID=3346529 RepID=UPI00364786B1
MIEPIVPPPPVQERIHGAMPVRSVPREADASLIYGMSVVGEGGRVTARAVLDTLGWQPGTRLSLSCPDDQLILLRPAADGSITVTAGGYLRVPVRTRRRVGLSYGDLVLVMAHRRCGGVLIHPPAALDGLLASSRRLLEVVP